MSYSQSFVASFHNYLYLVETRKSLRKHVCAEHVYRILFPFLFFVLIHQTAPHNHCWWPYVISNTVSNPEMLWKLKQHVVHQILPCFIHVARTCQCLVSLTFPGPIPLQKQKGSCIRWYKIKRLGAVFNPFPLVILLLCSAVVFWVCGSSQGRFLALVKAFLCLRLAPPAPPVSSTLQTKRCLSDFLSGCWRTLLLRSQSTMSW